MSKELTKTATLRRQAGNGCLMEMLKWGYKLRQRHGTQTFRVKLRGEL